MWSAADLLWCKVRDTSDEHGLEHIPAVLKDACMPEIRDLQIPLVVKHQILNSQVPMADSLNPSTSVQRTCHVLLFIVIGSFLFQVKNSVQAAVVLAVDSDFVRL